MIAFVVNVKQRVQIYNNNVCCLYDTVVNSLLNVFLLT